MTQVTAEGVAESLFESMPDLDDEERRLALTIYRLLAEGRPVRPERIAESAGLDRAAVDRALEEWPGTFRDEQGCVVSFWGLAQPEMPHRFEVDGARLHAWCAWDTLFLPALIRRTARVSSQCPVTGEMISLRVAPDGVEALSPEGAVVSMLVPADGFDADLIQSFCHHVHFFASPEAGEDWIAEREDAFLLTVDEAFRLGELWNQRRLGVTADV
jgi:alkylmercury lyase